MAIESRFPPVENADENGLLAVGGDLFPETLIDAYLHGIFPWPMGNEYPLTWFSPDPRGVLYLNEYHLPKSLKKIVNKNIYRITFNQNFGQVIHLCGELRKENTWLSPEMTEAYTQMFHHKLAYSVEVWREDQLVGGLYGVCLGSFFSAESMFHLESNTSKLAIMALVHKLKEKKIEWIDTQMTTPVVEALGGRLISRSLFLEQLKKLRFDWPRDLFLGS